MKLIIEDERGRREIDASMISNFIRDQLEQLKRWRDDGRKPSQRLLDDIRAYELLLGAKDPEAACREYQDRRVMGKSKLQIVTEMGLTKD